MAGEAAHAFSIAGGLHHAHYDRAAGFCIYNDPAIAIAAVRQEYGGRVAYVDVDAHHGDGVQERFYDDPHVLTISLHESGRYLFPGTGFVREIGEGQGYGFAANVPLEPYTGDDPFLAAFGAVVPPLLRAFQPDLIVVEAGADSHFTDPITHLATTTRLWPPLIEEIHALAHELCAGRLLVTGGGGYQPHTVVPRAWTLVFAALCGRVPADDRLPAEWLDLCRSYAGGPVPETLFDRDGLDLPPEHAERIAAQTERTVASLQNLLFPLHGLLPR
jgi:acetoin utilization protein AcuC